MNLSHLAQSIAESPTLKLNEEAGILKSKGLAVIHLGAGEPKNKAPIDAIQHASAKLTTGDIKYTPTDGIPSLKKAIARYTEEHYKRPVGLQNILVSGGAKQALFNLLYAIINPRDEVILLAPYWVSYPEMVRMVHGVPVIVAPKDDGFHPRMDEVRTAVTAATRAIIVNSPNNPSGIVFSKEFIGEIVEFCEAKGIYLIMDDIYHQLVFSGKSAVSAYACTTKDIESTMVVTINGVSKLYGMTGFRIGWVIASKPIIDVMINIQAQTTSCTSVLLQAAAEGALTGSQHVVEDLRRLLESNCEVMIRDLQSINGVRVTQPDGTFYCLPDFRHHNKNSLELSRFLLKKALVVTVPGKEFGMDGHLRLSYCGTEKEIREGVARIRWALDPSSPQEILIGDRNVVRDWL